jgi:hypothetical protein
MAGTELGVEGQQPVDDLVREVSGGEIGAVFVIVDGAVLDLAAVQGAGEARTTSDEPAPTRTRGSQT